MIAIKVFFLLKPQDLNAENFQNVKKKNLLKIDNLQSVK